VFGALAEVRVEKLGLANLIDGRFVEQHLAAFVVGNAFVLDLYERPSAYGTCTQDLELARVCLASSSWSSFSPEAATAGIRFEQP
jgi:hypothetical protein